MPRGKDKGVREAKHQRVCVMCGVEFKAVKEQAKTHDNRCRSALRRFKALWGCEPRVPPGVENLKPLLYQRDTWFALYLPADHPRNKPPEKQKVPMKKTRARPVASAARGKPRRKGK